MKLKQSQMRTKRLKGIIFMHTRNLLVKGSITSSLLLEHNRSLALDWLKYFDLYYNKINPLHSKYNLPPFHYQIETLQSGYVNVIRGISESETSPWLKAISPLLEDYLLVTLQGDASKFIISDETLMMLTRVTRDIDHRYSQLTKQNIYSIDEILGSTLFDEDLVEAKEKYGIEVIPAKYLDKGYLKI